MCSSVTAHSEVLAVEREQTTDTTESGQNPEDAPEDGEPSAADRAVKEQEKQLEEGTETPG